MSVIVLLCFFFVYLTAVSIQNSPPYDTEDEE